MAGTPLALVSESAASRPAAALAPYVSWYSGYRQAGPPARHRGLPSPYLTLIFTLDEPITLAGHPDPHQPPGSYQTLAGGLHTAPAIITHDGRQSGIQLMVTPLGAGPLLGVPAGELAHLDVEGAQVFGALAGQIQEQLRDAPDWPARFAVLDRLLTARLNGAAPARAAPARAGPARAGPARAGPAIAAAAGAASVSPGAAWAWRELLATGGAVSVADLAHQTGWSSRHLREVFRREIGLSPKAAARVIRFDRTRRLLQRQAATGVARPLADIAAGCGYYDQAHLAREFRELAGCPPSVWLAQECRNVQGGSAAPMEGSQA